jgi:ABC-type branched-subunit amino acid transport system permease subunit
VAGILTIALVLVCGLPGLVLFGYGSYSMLGGLRPIDITREAPVPGDLLPVAMMLVCLGWALMAIAVLMSWLAFLVSRKETMS